MRIRPRENRVLLEIREDVQTFGGGQFVIARVPDSEGDYPLFPQRGTVVEIGPDVNDLEVGDSVICTKYNGVRLPKREWGGQDLMLIREDFVLVKVETPDADIGYGKVWGDNSPRKR